MVCSKSKVSPRVVSGLTVVVIRSANPCISASTNFPNASSDICPIVAIDPLAALTAASIWLSEVIASPDPLVILARGPNASRFGLGYALEKPRYG